ncbi:MAG TPA: ricin-type beta-trefoil lectin domain protein [Candidatus Saccharimonadales bacterium]
MHQESQRKYVRTSQKPKKRFSRRLIFYIVSVIAVFLAFKIASFNISSAIPEIKSGIDGYCLDAHSDSSTVNATIDSWSCNGTDAQNWVSVNNNLVHDKKSCLSVFNNGNAAGNKIVSAPCGGKSGQIWIAAVDGYENPASADCLQVPNNQTNAQLILGRCTDLTEPNEAWTPAIYNKDSSSGASLACNGNEGQKVACVAAQQWVVWQSGSVSHSSLLNTYSDGNGYEEWCADFVSYVYKQAGYPFLYGERNNWDEYYAPNIQNQGFTYHSASNYTPKAGDVAYFDYNGGHVEIVAVGGSKPIFIYGDSGTTDKTTGNGDMAENSIINDGNSGQVIYYLSPN